MTFTPHSYDIGSKSGDFSDMLNKTNKETGNCHRRKKMSLSENKLSRKPSYRTYQGRKRFCILTLLSGMLFMALTVVSSLSPYAQFGSANRFGSEGMFQAVFFVAAIYYLPLILYALGLGSMRILLAVVVGMFTLGSAAILAILPVLASSPAREMLSQIWGVIIPSGISFPVIVMYLLCASEIVVNIVWYINLFHTRAKI